MSDQGIPSPGLAIGDLSSDKPCVAVSDEMICFGRSPPRFLKGGQHHSTPSQPSKDSAASATEDEDDLYAGKDDELDTAVAELHADVGELHADMPGRPHHWRHRKRMRRHENGYNEAAQIKALECTIVSAGKLLTPQAQACGITATNTAEGCDITMKLGNIELFEGIILSAARCFWSATCMLRHGNEQSGLSPN